MAEDKTGIVANVIQSIPFGSLIGGPLSACITAQADAAQAALDYVKMASMKDSTLGVDAFEPETVSFTFVVEGQKRVMVVPLLTILPVPFIRIEHVDLSFTADITACTENKEESKSKTEIKFDPSAENIAPKTRLLARYTPPKWESKVEKEGESTSKIEVKNLMEIDIHAVTSEMPSGLARLLEVFNTQLIQVDQLSEKTVERMKRRHDGIVPVQPVDPKKPKRPRQYVSKEEKKLLRQAYLAAIEAGDEKLARKIRNQVIETHGNYDAKIFLRAAAKQYENVPFLIRISSGLVDNPDCEYIPELSIEDNLAEQVRRQRNERKKLRADLIFALMTAKKMYPSGVKTKVGSDIVKEAWNSRTHRNQGWYTYGGGNVFNAFRSFVDSIITAEKARQKAIAEGKAGKVAEKTEPDPEKVKALNEILLMLSAQMRSVLGVLIEGAETTKAAKNPKKAARAASKATRQAKEAEDTAVKVAAEQKDKETKEAKAKDKAKDHAKTAATQAKKAAKSAKKKASAAAKKNASTTEEANDE